MAGALAALQGNPMVTGGDPTKQIGTVLPGVRGSITVPGAQDNGTVLACGAKLSGVDIAGGSSNCEHSSPEQSRSIRDPAQVAAARTQKRVEGDRAGYSRRINSSHSGSSWIRTVVPA